MNSERFTVPERVNFGNFIEIRAAGEAFVESHERTVFELGGVKDANSAVVALMLAWFRHAHRKQRDVAFVGATEGLRNILDLTELDTVLPVEV